MELYKNEHDCLLFAELLLQIMQQSAGRIDRLNTLYKDLYYYHLKSRSGIDLGISRSLNDKKDFNETRYVIGYSTLSKSKEKKAA